MTVRERARLLNVQNASRELEPPVEENFSALDKVSGFRPKLSQDLLQAAKSRVVKLAGKGKVGWQEATGSITGFTDLPRKSNGEALKFRSKETVMVVSPVNGQLQGATRELGDEDLTEATEELSSESTAKLGVKWKLPEIDRQAVGHLILVATESGKLMRSRLKSNYLSTSAMSRRNHSLQ